MSGNLVRRGSFYSVRLFIPVEFHRVAGKREIVKSLKTTDRRHAKLLLRRIQVFMERLFFYLLYIMGQMSGKSLFG